MTADRIQKRDAERRDIFVRVSAHVDPQIVRTNNAGLVTMLLREVAVAAGYHAR
jgi:hypothetical protein